MKSALFFHSKSREKVITSNEMRPRCEKSWKQTSSEKAPFRPRGEKYYFTTRAK
jgi:hypothetical protein